MNLRSTFLIVTLVSGICLNISGVSAAYENMQSGSGKIRVASCQFPVSADIKANYGFIESQIIEAKLKKADIVHFPECALSGYPGSDMETLDNFNWDLLHQMTDSVISTAKKHNCLYVISPEGKVTDRYDKRFCTSTDLQYSSPGDHFVSFNINGVDCGLLICYDIRFPELYREYRKLGCDVIFQSFYNARAEKGSIHPVIMPISAQAHAATNYFYMSLTNSSAQESWPCHFITPDGLIQNKLQFNVPGILISDIDLSVKYYDASREYRQDAMKGKLNSGTTVTDTLSLKRSIIY
jgi:predicted amidohydrolase